MRKPNVSAWNFLNLLNIQKSAQSSLFCALIFGGHDNISFYLFFFIFTILLPKAKISGEVFLVLA